MSAIDVPFAAPAATVPVARTGGRRRVEIGVCSISFVVLVAWLLAFPHTGTGDSSLHYLNARDAAVDPADILHSWARPGYKVFLAVFAVHGITAARLFMAAVSTGIVWQTIRLAADLSIPRPYLAGLLVLWQPMAFALAADTMTEMPMALGLVVAVRLWMNGWLATSCLVIGYLPSVRPEGFFFGVVWGLMVTFAPAVGPLWRRGRLLVALSAGLVAWVLACWHWTGDPWHVYHVWNWPFETYEAYGRGSLFHYVLYWPVYAGLPVTALFVAGVRPSLRPRMRLPWAVWAVVLGVHSVLYWRGWFASCGLMRILACTSPFTALVCLYGWDRAATWAADRGWGTGRRRRAGLALGGFLTAWTVVQYCIDPTHFDCFPLLRCTAFVRDHQLLAADTWFFAGNKIEIADLGLPAHRPNVMETPCDPATIRVNLAKLPLGAIGIWDNRQAPVWHGQTIDGLRANGFTVLYDTTTRFPWRDLRYVVLRKDGPFIDRPSGP